MSTARSNLQCALHGFLAFDIRKIHIVVERLIEDFRHVHPRGRDTDFTFAKLLQRI